MEHVSLPPLSCLARGMRGLNCPKKKTRPSPGARFDALALALEACQAFVRVRDRTICVGHRDIDGFRRAWNRQPDTRVL